MMKKSFSREEKFCALQSFTNNFRNEIEGHLKLLLDTAIAKESEVLNKKKLDNKNMKNYKTYCLNIGKPEFFMHVL